MTKLKLWERHNSWEEAEQEWDRNACKASASTPLKGLRALPQMAGITPKTKRWLKWKSLYWMISKDHKGEVWRGFWHHPFRYGRAFFRSLLRSSSYEREGDFFFYGIDSLQEFEQLIGDPDTLLVVGFSYCHKPFECPSGRFTPDCIADGDNPICQQCFIGKCLNALPQGRSLALVIPTVHYIGGKIFEVVHAYPDRQVIFLITACEMTLTMFGDWGNMVGIKGIGVRLDGRICNTMEAFALSEEGIKPGLTVVIPETQRAILELIKKRCKKYFPQ